ncbi:hypothetical protein [Methylophaga sp.]|uniref:hypothetical protein n=1 Tax=Methylophaga sp. TaxID=2024840 RepID=UPI003A8EDDC2
MRLWFCLRYLIARLTFIALRLPVSKLEAEVSALWRLVPAERIKRLDATLKLIRPRGENGQCVSSIAQLVDQRPLTKSDFRENASNVSKTSLAYSRHTAGTTGDPTHILLSKEELARMLAVRSYCYRHHGIRLGQREARIWGRAANTFGSKVRDFLLNRKVFYPAESNAKDIVSDLVSWKPQYVYGYTSLILEAAQILEENGLQPEGVKAVICTAEAILPAQKRLISSAFGAPVLEEYGSTEFDIVAFECMKGHLHLVNPWLWVESLNGSVVITDVSRKSQEIVRYELGDCLKLTETACGDLGHSLTISELKGRISEQIAYIGPEFKFHAVIFGKIFEEYMKAFEDCFCFSVNQITYYRFEIFISRPPKLGTVHLENFFMQKFIEFFDSDLGGRVIVSVRVGSEQSDRSKNTYFNLRIDQSAKSGI